LNAIAHRDYSIQNGIEVYIYTNRLEIKSPGALLSTLTINSLYQLEGAHESRNPLIARVLRENKLMRELGEGMKRIFALMNDNDLERPILHSNGLWFSITLKNKTVIPKSNRVDPAMPNSTGK
jgi:ATP-dependent DNA helicase RecG